MLVHVSRRAMASEFEVQFSAERYPQGTQLALQSLDRIDALEKQLSFFLAESEVSRVNFLAAEQAVAVSPALFTLLDLAVTVWKDTQGAYDITATPLWEVWGFARRHGRVPSDAELAEAKAQVGSDGIELDNGRQTVRFLRPGLHINLGSIGKGYALDQCAEQLQAESISDFLIHGGQSSVLARGLHESGTPWEVGIQHPGRPGHRLGVVRLHNCALGTSGGQFQSFRHQGRRYGHILDPRTGVPAEGVVSSTVVAPSCALADALSTAFYVLGPDPAKSYCETHPEVGFLLVCQGPGSASPTVHVGGLAPSVWLPAASS